jgi:hypothetical protein
MAYIKVLPRHSFGGTEKDGENSQDSPFLGRDLNPGPHEYEAGMLKTQPRRSVLSEWQSRTS